MSFRLKFFTVLVIAAAGCWLSASDVSQAQVTGGAPAKAAAPQPSPTPPVKEEDEVIKIETEVVNVLFTAQDRNRRLLTSLKKEDVSILEDGKRQEIADFSRQVDLPLSLAILIDTSASQ